MRAVAKSNKRLALLFAIFLAVFSTGMVIAHQCQSISSNQVAMQHQYSNTDSKSTAVTKPLNVTSNRERLIDSGCAAIFIVVLLFGRKYFDFSALRSRLNSFVTFGRELVTAYRPQVFQLALSLPQLGVIRV
jgi:beta-lactamase regulating signal transducer with metallopeptidase domain